MDKLVSLYNLMKKLRDAGVKMKTISEETDIASSVLSSLYSSVLPMYITLVSDGEESDAALDRALQQVNNVSKRKLLGCLDELYDKVSHMSPQVITGKVVNRPFLEDIEKESAKYLSNAEVYTGLYLGYSASSFSSGLKIEPYLISSVTGGESMATVYSQSMTGEFYAGIGFFSPSQIGYLMFNEQKHLQLALKMVYLQLPIISHPGLLKGIYLTHDYNRNPIARRIVLVRQGEEISLEEFGRMRTVVVPTDALTEEQIGYYNYTCMAGDVIKSIMQVAPTDTIEELKREKRLLELL